MTARKKLCLAALLLLAALCMLAAAPEAAPEESGEELAVVVTEEPAPEPTPAPTPSPEPAREGLTPPADLPDVDVHSWEFMLANSYNSVSFEYVVPVYGGIEAQGIDSRVFEAASSMLQAAREEGVQLYFSVAYRNMEYVTTMYQKAIVAYGDAAHAAEHVLGPGCNEHQTGLAVDITANQGFQANYYPYEEPELEDSPAYAWMMEHCAEYGFIYRYPEGKEAWYGTPCEHCHFRYVGVEAATYIMEHDLCLEEFLYYEDPSVLYVPGVSEERQ